jgi:hypothetical protein
VFALDDRFALNLDAVLPHVRAAEVIEERRPDVRVLRRATIGRMLVPHNEQGHGQRPVDGVFR